MLKCMVPTASPNREAILHTWASGVRSRQVCEDEMPLKGIKFRSSGFNGYAISPASRWLVIVNDILPTLESWRRQTSEYGC